MTFKNPIKCVVRGTSKLKVCRTVYKKFIHSKYKQNKAGLTVLIIHETAFKEMYY